MTHRLSRFGFVNAYLVEEEDGLTLIDTLMLGGKGPILAAAERLGAPIRRITLTHGHGDHVGSLDALVEALGPDVEVSISTRDARLLEKDTSLDPGEPGKKVTGSVPGTKTRPSRLLSTGDMVGSLQVVAAPGHTPGHVAFLDTRDRTLYCGDAYTTVGRVATSTGPLELPFPLAAGATWDGPTELATARALRALDPAALAPGHGGVVTNPGAAMDAAIARSA